MKTYFSSKTILMQPLAMQTNITDYLPFDNELRTKQSGRVFQTVKSYLPPGRGWYPSQAPSLSLSQTLVSGPFWGGEPHSLVPCPFHRVPLVSGLMSLPVGLGYLETGPQARTGVFIQSMLFWTSNTCVILFCI